MPILFFNTPMGCGFQYTDKNAIDLLQVVNFYRLVTNLLTSYNNFVSFVKLKTKRKFCIVFMILIN